MSALTKIFIEKCRDTSDPFFAAYLKTRGLEVQDVVDFKLGFYKWSLADGKNLNLPKIFDKSVFLPCFDDILSPIGFELRATAGKNHYKQYEASGRYHFFGMTERALDAIYTTGEVFLTEGTMDGISLSLWKPNVLSLMSNKISDEHLIFLRRYVKKMYLCFDMDKWGTRLQNKWARDLKGAEMYVTKFPYIKPTDIVKNRTGEMKLAKDANDLLVGLGKEKFIKLVNSRFADTY